MTRALALALVLLTSCKDKPEQRSEKAAAANDFWPDAPKTTSTNGKPRALAYQPANVKGYTISIDVHTTPGAAATVMAKMELGLAFKDAKEPSSRDAFFKKIDLDVDAAGQTMKMMLDNDQMTIVDKGEPMTLKRGDSGAFDVGAMLDTPFTTLSFANNHIIVTSNPANPFTALGGDMLDDALVLFPDLPTEPVAPGHTWTMVRNMPIGGGIGKFEVTYHFTYEGDGGCPSAAKSCAHLSFTASSKEATVESNGVSVTASYGFAGKVFLDLERGTIDESRVRMDMDVKAAGQSLPMGGTFVVKPS
jgi:hypothetical protein